MEDSNKTGVVNRTPSWIGWTVAAVPSLMTVGSGISKVMHVQMMVDNLTKTGFGNYITLIGISEIVFVALYLVPRSLNLGFLLLCCFFGGAISTHVGSGESPMVPAVILILFWIATFIRKRSIFGF